MQAKRLMFGGKRLTRVGPSLPIKGLEHEKWHHFRIEAGPDGLDVQIGDQRAVVAGRTETKGPNSVLLGPGAKLRGT